MEKLKRFVAKNQALSMVIFSVFLCAAYSFLLVLLKFPVWAIVLLNLFLIFINYCFVYSAYDRLLQKPLLAFDNGCDPYPLLYETEALLSYKISEQSRQILLINRAAALRCLGDYQKVYDILNSINIDKCSGMLPIQKTVYYNNLFDICCALSKNEEANIWYNKFELLYRDIKNAKQRKILEPTFLAAKASYCFINKNYEEALKILDCINSGCNRLQVHNSLSYAKIYIVLGNNEKAKEKLKFVIENGNKLYCVFEAKNMLHDL